MTERSKILGRGLFEVFPDNPDNPKATGVSNLSNSLKRVLKNKTADTMAVQKYDIRQPESEGGGFEERFWSPVNSPVFKLGTKEIIFIIHRVEDVTEFARREREGAAQNKKMEVELYLRAQELQETNKKLLEVERVLESRVEERTEALRRAQQQLVQQERLRALGQMASGIAHDFNNALSPILGYTELILDSPEILDDKTTAAEYMRAMNTSAKDASGVVRRLREFSRAREESEAFTAIGLNDLVKEVLMMTQPKWKNQALARGVGIQLGTTLTKVPDIYGSKTEIRELLTNLIFNAVDAMPKGGTVTLSTRAENDRTVLEVADTGTGMSEEVRRRCLEPFFTTKGDKGTGLGLSMVYGIIQRHEGTIDIRSKIGEGTTFILTFPVLKESQKDAQPGRVTSVFSRKLRILYVEDEQPVREVFTRYLERDGHSVDALASGRDALAKFDPSQYDLVITDHAMPGMSGEEFASELKRLAPKKPVVLLSGTADHMTVSGKSSGIDAILKKPVTLEELRCTLAGLFP